MIRKHKNRQRKSLRRPVIALLTDFGNLDHYVGTMKGVILSINHAVRIVDISHNVDPQNVAGGGFMLWASYRYFPANTIFVCVVDPGVGTIRRIVCLETSRYQFVAPDNGLLDMVIAEEKAVAAYEITNPPQFGSHDRSATFHGRDIFAPVGAHLSLGESVRKFGKKCSMDKTGRIFYDLEKDAGEARILHIDRFGNLITNVRGSLMSALTMKVGARDIVRRIRNFSEGAEGEPCLILGSSGLMEIVVRDGSAAKTLGAHSGMQIQVVPEVK